MLPRALLLTAVVLWGWTFVATRVLVAELGPVEIFALRLAIGLPFLGLVLLLKRVRVRFGRMDARPLLVGGAVLALHFLIQIAGLVTTTATNTAWIVAASPLALAAAIALGGGLVLAGVYVGQRGSRRDAVAIGRRAGEEAAG